MRLYILNSEACESCKNKMELLIFRCQDAALLRSLTEATPDPCCFPQKKKKKIKKKKKKKKKKKTNYFY